MSSLEFTSDELKRFSILLELLGKRKERIPEVFDPEAEALAIAQRHGISVKDLKGHSRVAHMVRARKELYLALHEHGWSTPAIGRFVGGRDHTTVLQQLGRLTGK